MGVQYDRDYLPYTLKQLFISQRKGNLQPSTNSNTPEILEDEAI